MQTQLTSLSPLSYVGVVVGTRLTLMIKTPRKTEYRGSIGPAVRSVLVFKGGTKIGMIPSDFVSRNPSLLEGGFSCTVSEISPERKRIIVDLERP